MLYDYVKNGLITESFAALIYWHGNYIFQINETTFLKSVYKYQCICTKLCIYTCLG